MLSLRCGNAERLARNRDHLAQRGETAKRLQLDLADALAGEAQTATDVLERLRIAAVEAVAEGEHLPLAVGERPERLRQSLAAQRYLDLLLGEGVLARDEIAEDGVLL